MTSTDDRCTTDRPFDNTRLRSSPTESRFGARNTPADTFLRWLGHQRWVRYGVRDRLIRALRNPETIAQRSFETDFAGFRYPGDLSRWIDWIVFFFGAYELDELELLRGVVPNDGLAVAIDIGANVGHHSLFMASFCAQVHAFEPFEGVAHLIDEKIRRNGLDRIVVHRVGLGDSDDELSYFAPAGSNIGNGTFVSSLADGAGEASCVLTVRHGDRYFDKLSLPRIDLIKIDVEGFELKVLEGIQRTLCAYRPVVMLELSDSVREQLGSLDRLLSLLPPDYDVQRILPPSARLTFFSSGHARLGSAESGWSSRTHPGHYVNLLLRPKPH